MNRLISFLEKNYIPLLFSFFLALLLWIAVTTNKYYTQELTVPFSISRIADGYVLTKKPPEKVVLEVRGKGRSLIGTNLYASSIDLELPEINTSTTINLSDYQNRFDIPRNLGIEIVEILEPQNIKLEVDSYSESLIKVKTVTKIKPLPGYVLSAVTVDSQLIKVSGPKKILESLTEIETDSITRNDVRYPFSEKVKLINPYPDVVQISPKSVNVDCEINQLVERTLYNIPIQLVGVPGQLTASASPQNVTIRVKGSEPLVSRLNPNQVTAIFNYRNNYQIGKTIYQTNLQIPEGIELMNVSPARFKLQLKKKEEID